MIPGAKLNKGRASRSCTLRVTITEGAGAKSVAGWLVHVVAAGSSGSINGLEADNYPLR